MQDCPSFIKKSFGELFSGNGFNNEDSLTVMTITQKTKNDMATWSEEVENEREALFEIVSVFIVCKSNLEATSKYFSNTAFTTLIKN